MNPAEKPGQKTEPFPPPPTPEAPAEDPRLVAALEEYLDALETGRLPDREDLLARYPEVAGSLASCLENLDFVHRAARNIRESSSGTGRMGLPAAAAESIAGQPLGDYRLIREIGRGGMGVVYEAEQLSLGRRVAVKVLPFVAALDPAQLQRFKNEAHAAAQLHHPHIVPVFAVGCERGVHYYAMQYIEGQSLSTLIRGWRQRAGLPAEGYWDMHPEGKSAGVVERDSSALLPLGQRTTRSTTPAPFFPPGHAAADTRPRAHSTTALPAPDPETIRTVARLGLQAAEALEYSHQEGVVHRDVKPANLLVDVRGNLWVTDFGLARFANDPGLTRTGSLLGTLRYMSPEQARGRPGILDQRTDIYSLGATLYELLTLVPAFPGTDRQQLLRQIEEDEPRRPRALNRAIPVELEIIVLKAMAKAPAERYPTAREVADDLQRFLERKPILARPPSWLDRATKWARRHRYKVCSGVCGTLLLVAAALTASLFGNVVLVGQRDSARAHRHEAWQAADEMYTQVAEHWLAYQAHLEPTQREFLLKALGVYERFLREEAGDPFMRLEVARASRRVGDIHQKLGGYQQAEPAYQRAIRLLEGLATQLPTQSAYREELGLTHNDRGNLLRAQARLGEAEAEYAVALSLFEALASEQPDVLAYRTERAGALANRGVVSSALGRYSRGEKDYRQALGLLESLNQKDLATPAYAHDRANCLNDLGQLLGATGRPREAENAFRQALSVWDRLLTRDPGTPAYRQSEAVTWTSLSVLLLAQDRYAEAAEANHRGLALAEGLTRDFPRVPAYKQELASSLAAEVCLLEATGRRPEALQTSRRVVTLWATLLGAPDSPEVVDYRRGLADAQEQFGGLLTKAGQLAEAEKAYRQSLELRARLTGEFPQRRLYYQDEARTRVALGELLQARGRLREAEQLGNEGLAVLERLGAESPEMMETRWREALLHNQLGVLRRNTGRIEEAEGAFRKALEQVERLAADFPEIKGLAPARVAILDKLGALLQATNRSPEAEPFFRKALPLAEELVRSHPEAPVYRASLADVLVHWAGWQQDHGLTAEAEDSWKRALDLRRQLAAAPDSAADRQSLAEMLYRRGVFLTSKGRAGEGGPAINEALAILEKLASEYAELPGVRQDLAWYGAARPGVNHHDARRAVAWANGAVELAPDDGNGWNALGAASYRAGDWLCARSALEKAGQLGCSGLAVNGYFHAMTLWQLGDRPESRRCFERAETLGKQSRDEGLRQLRQEALSLLGSESSRQP